MSLADTRPADRSGKPLFHWNTCYSSFDSIHESSSGKSVTPCFRISRGITPSRPVKFSEKNGKHAAGRRAFLMGPGKRVVEAVSEMSLLVYWWLECERRRDMRILMHSSCKCSFTRKFCQGDSLKFQGIRSSYYYLTF